MAKYEIKDGVGIIPEGTIKIEENAFEDCVEITSAIIPNSVREIGKYAFNGCTGLTSIVIPDSVTEIGWEAFNGCTGLTSIVIPNSVTKIGTSAFYGCTGLTSIVIPDSVTKVSSSTFKGCSLTSIKVSEGNKKYDSRDNCNAIIDTEANKLVVGCATTVIPDSVTEIGGDAFNGRKSLTSIVIPDSVTEIEEGAFKGCTGLTSIVIPKSVKMSIEIFSNCTALETLTLGTGIKKIDASNFEGVNLKVINVPAKKADFYKQRLPESLRSLIVELPAEKKK